MEIRNPLGGIGSGIAGEIAIYTGAHTIQGIASLTFDSTTSSLISSGTQLLLEETGDFFGPAYFAVRNRPGSNGGILTNLSLPLSDLGFAASTIITNIAIDGSNNLTVTTLSGVWTVGQTVTLSGLTTATFLNGKVVTIATASSTQFTASYTHALYASAPDTGTVYVQNNFRMETRQNQVTVPANTGGEFQFIDIRGDGAGGIVGAIWFSSGRNGTVLSSGFFNSVVGFRQNGTATSGHVLRGNGTNFVDAALAASDLSNGVTGSGAVVLAAAPLISNPFLSGSIFLVSASLIPTVNSANALSVLDATQSYYVQIWDTTNKRVSIGGTFLPSYTLDVLGDINTSTLYRVNGTPGVTQTAIAVGTLATMGGIVTTFTGVSDERLKISTPYEGGLDVILGITPIRYRWNELGQKWTGLGGEQEFVGFSANNVQKSLPEAILSTEGKEQYLSFDDRPVIAALVNAVKELTARIAVLETR